MRLAFLTMVWQDHWLLNKWVQHNSQYTPRSSLYVINHGGDPAIHAIAEGCNVIDIPRDEVTLDLTRKRWDMLGAFTNGLLAFHDRVICTDVDELICYLGTDSLQDHLATAGQDVTAVSPVGLNLMPAEDMPDAADLDDGVLPHHHRAFVSAKYTKPCIARDRVVFTTGGHGLQRGAFEIDPQLLLIHLHYVTPDYAERMQARKDIVAQSRAHNDGLDAPLDLGNRFWINWARSETIREKELGNFNRAEELDVTEGFGGAADALRGAISRNRQRMVVDHAEMNKAPKRVTIPQALRHLL